MRIIRIMTAIRHSLLILGAALLCAPLLVYVLDSTIGLGRLDPLTLSTMIGGTGAGVFALSQGDHWGRFFLALLAGLLLIAVQVYGIAFLVLQANDL